MQTFSSEKRYADRRWVCLCCVRSMSDSTRKIHGMRAMADVSTRSTHREGNRSVAKIIYVHWMAMWSILLYRFAERTKHLIFGILEFVVELLSANRWMIPYIFIFIFWWCLNWWLYYNIIFGIWKSIGVWLKCSRCSVNLQILLYIFSLALTPWRWRCIQYFITFCQERTFPYRWVTDSAQMSVVRPGTIVPYILVFTAKRQTQSEHCGKNGKWFACD